MSRTCLSRPPFNNPLISKKSRKTGLKSNKSAIKFADQCWQLIIHAMFTVFEWSLIIVEMLSRILKCNVYHNFLFFCRKILQTHGWYKDMHTVWQPHPSDQQVDVPSLLQTLYIVQLGAWVAIGKLDSQDLKTTILNN